MGGRGQDGGRKTNWISKVNGASRQVEPGEVRGEGMVQLTFMDKSNGLQTRHFSLAGIPNVMEAFSEEVDSSNEIQNLIVKEHAVV